MLTYQTNFYPAYISRYNLVFYVFKYNFCILFNFLYRFCTLVKKNCIIHACSLKSIQKPLQFSRAKTSLNVSLHVSSYLFRLSLIVFKATLPHMPADGLATIVVSQPQPLHANSKLHFWSENSIFMKTFPSDKIEFSRQKQKLLKLSDPPFFSLILNLIFWTKSGDWQQCGLLKKAA